MLISRLNVAILFTLVTAIFSPYAQAKESDTTWQKYTDLGSEALNQHKPEQAEKFYAAAFAERKVLPPYKDLLTAGYTPKMIMSTHNLDEVSCSLIVYYEGQKRYERIVPTCNWILSDPNHVRLAVQAYAWLQLAETQNKLGKKDQAKKCYAAFDYLLKRIDPRKKELNMLDLANLSKCMELYSRYLKTEGKISQSEEMSKKAAEYKELFPFKPLSTSK